MCNVSVLMPVHNAERFLPQAIESVLCQSFENWELIIVDDGSKDTSRDIIAHYQQKDARIKAYWQTECAGAAVARNLALQMAQGRYIAFLDSDDQWLPEKLAHQLNVMRANGYAFTYTAYEKITAEGRVTSQVAVPSQVSYRQLLKCCVIGCLTAMYDSHQLGKVAMPLIQKRQDFGLWLRLLKKVDVAHGIQHTLARYRVHQDSLSANKLAASRYTWKLYREHEKLGVIEAGYFFAHYAVRGFVRLKAPRVACLVDF